MAVATFGASSIVAVGCADASDDGEDVASLGSELGKWNTAQPGRDCLQGDGLYCGNHGVKGSSDALYECRHGQYRRVQTCSKTQEICYRMPDGTNDECGPDGPGPGEGIGIGGVAGSCAGHPDARYCGQNFISFGDRDKLYECRGGVGYLIQVCASGCNAVSGPEDDSCKSAASAPSSSAPICGSGLTCEAGAVSGATECRQTASSTSTVSCCPKAGSAIIAGKCVAPCGTGLTCSASAVVGASACVQSPTSTNAISCCSKPGSAIIDGKCVPPCGTGLSCAASPVIGGSACVQSSRSTSAISCCPSGQSIVDGQCR